LNFFLEKIPSHRRPTKQPPGATRLADMARRAAFSLGRALRETAGALDTAGLSALESPLAKEAFARHRPSLALYDSAPAVAPDAFVAPSATLAGAVTVGARAAVWYGAVLRGDDAAAPVTLGAGASVGERAVLHCARSVEGHVGAGLTVGAGASIGPGAALQSCTIEDGAVIGANAVRFAPRAEHWGCTRATRTSVRCRRRYRRRPSSFLARRRHPAPATRHRPPAQVVCEGALVEAGAQLAPGAVVHPGRRIPARTLWAGNPAAFVRDLTKSEIADAEGHAEEAADVAAEHAAAFLPQSTVYRHAEALGVEDAVRRQLGSGGARARIGAQCAAHACARPRSLASLVLPATLRRSSLTPVFAQSIKAINAEQAAFEAQMK
jgi:carbonic anhydrase/acetyltransferase-like protein (isoleucine patch superfamily)